MGKRIRKILMAAVCTALLTGGLEFTASAATIKAPYMAEQAQGKAPDVKVYMTGAKMKGAASVSGTIGNIPLAQKGEIVPFETSGDGIRYIVLLDNSGSVNRNQFEEAKKQLVKMRKSLKENDEMLLYTVGSDSPAGEKKDVLKRTVKGSEKEKKARDCKKIKNIEYMASASSMTVLYRSLNEILAAQTSPDMRTIVLLVTDGEDDSKGKDIDKVSTEKEVKNASVPVYGVLLHKDSGETDNKISYTKNKILAEQTCRGYYYDCSTDTSEKSVKKAFAKIDKLLQKETYVVNLKAATNQTAGKEKLKLTVDNSAINSVVMDYSDYKKDESGPSISGDVTKVSAKSIEFSLKDENGVNLDDANKKSNYHLQTRKKNNDGKVWEIESVNAVSEGEKLVVTLTTKDKFSNADYVLECSDIRDKSKDENKMDDAAEFKVKDGRNAVLAAITDAIKAYWWVGLILVIVIIGIFIIRAVKKKAVKIVEVDPNELSKADNKLIRLTITDRAGAIKDVEWNVEGSLFVGRSDICNIYFDDDRLSKQHFVIEVNKMGCYIEDLESTNGTFVNGVKMTNRRMLLDGDVITVGREKIVFHVPKNQPVEDVDGEQE